MWEILLINLYYAREFAPLSSQMWCIFPRVIQINTKLANFARLYLPHFTTFRDQTLQCYSLKTETFSAENLLKGQYADINGIK
jgi:hypothetical protein